MQPIWKKKLFCPLSFSLSLSLSAKGVAGKVVWPISHVRRRHSAALLTQTPLSFPPSSDSGVNDLALMQLDNRDCPFQGSGIECHSAAFVLRGSCTTQLPKIRQYIGPPLQLPVGLFAPNSRRNNGQAARLATGNRVQLAGSLSPS